MKTKYTLLYFSIFLFFSQICFKAVSDDSFSDFSVNISTAPTPIFFVQNVSNNLSMNSINKWIIIEISYNLVNNSYKNNPINDLNRNFTIKLDTLIAGQSNLFLLSAKVVFTAVALNTNKKYAMFLIPPQIIAKITPPGKNINNTYLKKSIQIRASFLENNNILNVFYYPKNNSTKQAFDNISSNVIQIQNGLLNRMQTPWSVINYDKYELISE